MTDRELAAQAEAHFRKTTITYQQWVAKKNLLDVAYAVRSEWGKGFAALAQIGLAAPTPPAPEPPPPGVASLAQNVIFCAWNPHAGLRASPAHKLAVTADWYVTAPPDGTPEQRSLAQQAYLAAAKQAAQQQHARGGQVPVWGNQEQISLEQIAAVGKMIDADYRILQAETEAEAQSALDQVDAGFCNVVIGNPNAWTQAQRDRATKLILAGRLAFIFEVYTNEGAPWPDTASAAGVPAASLSPGVGWGKTPYQLVDYKAHTRPESWPSISPYLAEGFDEQSWGLLP